MNETEKAAVICVLMIVVAALIRWLPLTSSQDMTITGVISDNLDIEQSGRGGRSQTIRGLPNGELEINGVRLRGNSRGRKIRNTNGKVYVDDKLMKAVNGEYQ